MARNASARTIHAVADAMGLDPERVGVLAKEAGASTKAAVEQAVKAWLEAEAARTAPADEPKPPRVKKASLTLSQRRALLKLQAEPQVPASAFKELPYLHLVEVGLATQSDEGYVLTEAGRDRADSINPGYLVWSQGESVCGDESRPPAGTAKGIYDIEPDLAPAE